MLRNEWDEVRNLLRSVEGHSKIKFRENMVLKKTLRAYVRFLDLRCFM